MRLDLLVAITVFLSSSPVIPSWLRILLMVVITLYLLFKKTAMVYFDFFAIFLTSFMFVCSLINDLFYLNEYGLNTLSFLYIPFSFYIGYLISKVYSFEDFMNSYERVIKFFAIISLLFFFSILIKPSLVDSFFNYQYYHTQHKTMIFYNVVSYVRNSGFSSEPGFYQLFIAIALWWRLKSKKIEYTIIVYIVTIITTFSTAGFISLIILLLLHGGLKLQLVSIFMLIVFNAQVHDLYTHQKENKLSSSSVAFEGRSQPFFNALEYSKDNIFGVGSIKYTGVYEEKEIGGWDSFSQIMLRYGIQGIFVICIFLFFLAKNNLSLFFIILITFFSQNIWFIPIVSCLFFYAFRFDLVKYRRIKG